MPGVAGTVNMLHIKAHYYGSHATINPTGIVPVGPEIDHSGPHDRGRFRAESKLSPAKAVAAVQFTSRATRGHR